MAFMVRYIQFKHQNRSYWKFQSTSGWLAQLISIQFIDDDKYRRQIEYLHKNFQIKIDKFIGGLNKNAYAYIYIYLYMRASLCLSVALKDRLGVCGHWSTLDDDGHTV